MKSETFLNLSYIAIFVGAVIGGLGLLGQSYFRDQIAREKEAAAQAKEALKKQGQSEAGEKQINLAQPTFSQGSDFVMLSFGGFNTPVTKVALEKGPARPIGFGETTPLTLYMAEGKLYVDVTLFDALSGGPVILKRNELRNKPPGWDMNSNDKALEVVDEKNRPVFQLIYKTPTEILITGRFASPTGILLCAEGSTVTGATPEEAASFALQPIFKHPAWKFPGQYQ